MSERNFFYSIADSLGMKDKEDWYKMTKEDVIRFGGERMLEKHFNGSVRKALETNFPYHSWKTWKFGEKIIKPRGYWNDEESQRNYLIELGREMEVKEWSDWYDVTIAEICEKGGSGLLFKYDNSPSKMITSLLNEHSWEIDKFTRRPKGYLGDLMKQRNYLEDLGKELNIKKMEDWYRVSIAQIAEKRGQSLLMKYNKSPSKMITSIFSDHEWDMEKFAKMPKGYYMNEKLQRDMMDRLGKELNIKEMEDWYHVTKPQIYEKGGGRLLEKYQQSPSKMITSVLNEHEWEMQKFAHKPKNFWESMESQRGFLKTMKKELKIVKMGSWRKITKSQIIEKGGGSLLTRYGGSPYKMMTSVFPEHNWKSWQKEKENKS